MLNQTVKCITCEKQIIKAQALKDFDVFFCSEKCLVDYKEHLKKINKDFNLEDCC
jgi:endogenous inhibitor of DNA gyrase (YacG/DUF329 family)